MNPKFWGMLSLAMRAGKVVAGEEKVTEIVRSGKAFLLILAEDAGSNTAKKVKDMAAYRNLLVLRPGDRDEIGRTIGRKFAVVLAIIDQGFAEQLIRLCGDTQE